MDFITYASWILSIIIYPFAIITVLFTIVYYKQESKKLNSKWNSKWKGFRDFFIILYISIASIIILIFIELVILYSVMSFTQHFDNIKLLNFQDDPLPTHFLFWVFFLLFSTSLLYMFSIKVLKKFFKKKYIKNYILPIFRWSNILAFFLSTYTILLGLYFSSLINNDNEAELIMNVSMSNIHVSRTYVSIENNSMIATDINIWIFTLILTVIAFVNNFYFNKLTKYIEEQEVDSKLEKLLNQKLEEKIEFKVDQKLKEATKYITVTHKPSNSMWWILKILFNKK